MFFAPKALAKLGCDFDPSARPRPVAPRENVEAVGLGREVALSPNDPTLAIEALSGGNQQQVVIARWLATGRKLLICAEPTAGVDVGAKAEIYALINKALGDGVGVIVASTYQIAIAKADRIRAQIEKLGGTVRGYVDRPIADTSNRMPTLTTALLQKYGAFWTHSLAINEIYVDFMGPSLAFAGHRGRRQPESCRGRRRV